MDVDIPKLGKRDYEKAQSLYFCGRTVEEICTVLKCDPETIRFFVFGIDGDGKDKTSWFSIKKKMNSSLMSLYLVDKIGVLEQTCGIGLEILNKSLVNLRDRLNDPDQDPLTIDEMSKLAGVVVSMDKMVRLESGLATEITEHMGMSIAEAREVLANDPFANAVECEVIKLPWLEENNE